jgi:carbon monoxide dehydrogenase subunit G
MPQVEYSTTVDIPRDVLWNFVKDFKNWAPLLKGYKSHEMVNEKESIWIIKGQFGAFSRTTKFHTTITEWVEGERVAFKLKGLNEPVTGYGWVNLASDDSNKNTTISSEVGAEAGGVLGPLVNRLVKPWLTDVAEELVTKLVAAVKKA